MGGTGLSPAPEVTVLMVLDVLSSPAPAPELSLERFCRCLLLGARRGHRQGTEGDPTGSRPLPPQCWDTGALPWSSSIEPGSLCIDSGQINLRFYPSRGRGASPGGGTVVPESDSPKGESLARVPEEESAGWGQPQASLLAGSGSGLAGGGCATTGIWGSGKEERQVSASAPPCGAREQRSHNTPAAQSSPHTPVGVP